MMARSSLLPFQHAKLGGFLQAPPHLGNVYTGDAFLARVLERLLPPKTFAEVHADLERLGGRVESEIDPLGVQCESNEPVLRQFDAWGRRVDELVTCPAWKRMKEITAEEGIVSSGYSGKFGEFGRIFQFAKCLVFHASSGLYSCPIAMTDGAAKTLQELKLPQFDSVLKRLTSQDPAQFWTSGQWMTERGGGSDVVTGTETVATPKSDGTYTLHGYKWFSSATDADIALTLARIVDKGGKAQDGLSMFLLKTRREDGSLDPGIQMMKLKNKLGTRSLPTAELLLDGVVAQLVSDPGRGVAAISHMLTVTRLHNTTGSVAAMRRILLLARDYSMKRVAFGVPIAQHRLHVDTLAGMELTARAATLLFFEVVRLFGLSEHETVRDGSDDDENRQLLRLLTPVVKLYTAKKCIPLVSEGLECFGGQGYIEDTHLPVILRNAQVTTIWEGTTNVLSLDTLRAIAKSNGAAITAFHANMSRRLRQEVKPDLAPSAARVQAELDDLVAILPALEATEVMARARLVSFAIAEIAIGVLFIEHASSRVAKGTDLAAAKRWASQMTKWSLQFKDAERFETDNSNQLVFEGYPGPHFSKTSKL